MDNKILYTAKFTHHDLKFHKVWWKRTNDLEAGPDRQTGRFLHTPSNYVCGGYNNRCRRQTQSYDKQLMWPFRPAYGKNTIFFNSPLFFFFLQYLKVGLGLKIYPLHQKVHSNHPTQSPVLKGHLFLYCHMSCTSFMRSFVLKDHFFFVPKVTS